jgi:hypothetical protein
MRRSRRERRRLAALIAAVCVLHAGLGRPTRAADVRPSYDVSLTIDLDAGTYAGRELVRFANRSKDELDAVYFNLYPNVGARTTSERMLSVTSVRVGGQPAVFVHQGSGLLVRLSEGLESGASAEVELEFEGRATRLMPEQAGLGAHVTDQVSVVLAPAERRPRRGSEQLVVSGDAMLLGNPFPLLSAARDESWRRVISAGDFAFAESASYRIAVTAGADVAVVAPGVEGERTDGGARVFTGEALRTVAVFASRGFVRRESESSGVRLAVVARPEHEPAARAALAVLERAVALYVDAFGGPPLAQLTVVEAPLGPGTPSAGYSGVVAVASAYFIDMRGPEAKDLPGFIKDSTDLAKDELEFAVLQEAARQWWGESVGTDPQRAAFLDEGLSTVSALVAVERAHGADGAAAAVEQRVRAPYRVYRMFGGQDATVGGRAGELPNYFAYAAIVNSKSAMFVAELRRQLGDEKFYAGLRRYYEGGAGRIVTPERFAEAMAPSKSDRVVFNRLFDRWIKERHGDEDIGAPEYAVAVDPKVASDAASGDPDRPGIERFGRFLGRKFAWFGKTAAKPF